MAAQAAAVGWGGLEMGGGWRLRHRPHARRPWRRWRWRGRGVQSSRRRQRQHKQRPGSRRVQHPLQCQLQQRQLQHRVHCVHWSERHAWRLRRRWWRREEGVGSTRVMQRQRRQQPGSCRVQHPLQRQPQQRQLQHRQHWVHGSGRRAVDPAAPHSLAAVACAATTVWTPSSPRASAWQHWKQQPGHRPCQESQAKSACCQSRRIAPRRAGQQRASRQASHPSRRPRARQPSRSRLAARPQSLASREEKPSYSRVWCVCGSWLASECASRRNDAWGPTPCCRKPNAESSPTEPVVARAVRPLLRRERRASQRRSAARFSTQPTTRRVARRVGGTRRTSSRPS